MCSFTLILLAIVCTLVFLLFLDKTPFHDKGEPREALVVRDIVLQGRWLLPLQGRPDAFKAAAVPLVCGWSFGPSRRNDRSKHPLSLSSFRDAWRFSLLFFWQTFV